MRHLFGHFSVVSSAMLFWVGLFWAGFAGEEVGCCGDWAGGGRVGKAHSERRGEGTQGHQG